MQIRVQGLGDDLLMEGSRLLLKVHLIEVREGRDKMVHYTGRFRYESKSYKDTKSYQETSKGHKYYEFLLNLQLEIRYFL